MKLIVLMMLMLMTGCSDLFLLGSIGGTVVSQTPVVKTYNGVDTLTIIKTKKGIKQHAYDKLKEVNDNK